MSRASQVRASDYTIDRRPRRRRRPYLVLLGFLYLFVAAVAIAAAVRWS